MKAFCSSENTDLRTTRVVLVVVVVVFVKFLEVTYFDETSPLWKAWAFGPVSDSTFVVCLASVSVLVTELDYFMSDDYLASEFNSFFSVFTSVLA